MAPVCRFAQCYHAGERNLVKSQKNREAKNNHSTVLESDPEFIAPRFNFRSIARKENTKENHALDTPSHCTMPEKEALKCSQLFEFIFAHYILIFFGILILKGNHTHGFIRHQCIFTHLQQQHSKPKQVFFTTCDKI